MKDCLQYIPKFQFNVDATFSARIFKASCLRVNCNVGVLADGGLGGASTSTTRSLVGFELAFLVSTVRNSSIKSHADGSIKINKLY